MVRKLENCRLSLKDALPALKRRGALVGQSPGAAAATGQGLLRTDSRLVGQGDIFLAYRGVAADGHVHLEKAASRGAGLLVVEDPAAVPQGVKTPWLAVRSGRAAWTYLAAEAFGNPQDKLTLLGATGTNGKTSTVWMTGELLRAAGFGCLTIGTLGAYFGDEHLPTKHTTPDPDVLYALLAEAVKSRLPFVAMEVSSHAVCQEKLLPLRFAATVFTSFSRDHLDFHPTLDDYWEAKWRLFTELARGDARQGFWDGLPRDLKLATLSGETFAYGLHAEDKARAWGAGNFLALTVEDSGFTGSRLALRTKSARTAGHVPYFARHAVENFAAAHLLASSAAGHFLGADTWAKLSPVPGRLEQVVAPGGKPGPQVVVDYAHTPDALEKTLGVLRPFCKGRLSVVFGCGGDRDRGKRPVMGRIAEELADRVYVTSDNPRTEDPAKILADITAGFAVSGAATVEVDRETAIRRAVTDAGLDDMVLIAGKGHETYQILGARTVAFDDREVARRYLGKDR